jgi:Ca2+-binding EF-hand superfamily protein
LEVLIKIAELFDHYDTNKDGALNREELKLVHSDFLSQGIISERVSVDDLMREMDLDGDRLTQYDEFLAWLERNGVIGG